MTDFDTTDLHTVRHRLTTHWLWFFGILAVLGISGVVVAVLLLLPLAMATDNCHDSSTDWVCGLSARGQTVLVLTPWIWMLAGTVSAITGALIATRFRWSPLTGLPVGVLAYFLMIPLGNAIAGWV